MHLAEILDKFGRCFGVRFRLGSSEKAGATGAASRQSRRVLGRTFPNFARSNLRLLKQSNQSSKDVLEREFSGRCFVCLLDARTRESAAARYVGSRR